MRSALEQLLLPAECLTCRALLPFELAERIICPVCRTRWRHVAPPWCDRCGQPEPLFGGCRICRHWPERLRAVRSAVWLDDTTRPVVHALKYRNLPRLTEELSEAVAALEIPNRDRAVLVPVPLARRRLLRRGYNQSERLARSLARRWRRPVADLLARTRETATQTALTPGAREANVAGAFGLRIVGADVKSAVILVDDVFTTGATLASAARALEDAGARSIAAVTFGRAAIPDFT